MLFTTNCAPTVSVVRRANKPSEARLVSEALSERMRREGRTRRTTLDCFGECLHQLLNGPLLIERKRFRWLAKNMLAKLGFPFMERKFSFISKSCFYEAYVKNT